MKIDVLISCAFRVILTIAFLSGVAVASPYGRPLEEDLIKSEAVFLGRVLGVVGEDCLKIDLLFSIQGGFSDADLFCVAGEYGGEFDVEFLLQQHRVVFFAKKNHVNYSPFFHYASLAYLNGRNCVAMPAVFNESGSGYILEGFDVFLRRFGVVNFPREFAPDGGCKEW